MTTPHHAGLARIPANSPGAAAAAPAIRLPLFTHARPNVSPKEVAEVTSISDQQVRDMVEEGIFLAVSISDAGTAVRQHLRIVRSSVEAWWLERFLVTNGFEYPVTNSPEITWWRLELRKKRKDVGGRS